MNELVGKKIGGISVSDDQQFLYFSTDQGMVGYEAYGECCSETWFADINGVDALIGGTVKKVEEVPAVYQVFDGRGRQESDVVYGYKLITDKGYADIVFRNSSNGFYGGDVGECSKAKPPKGMIAITQDWSA